MTEGWDATGLLHPLWTPLGGRDRLAALTGITPGTLSGYNTGRLKLGLKNAQRIAEVTGVSLAELGQPLAEVEDSRSLTLRGRLEALEAQTTRQAKALRDMTRRLATTEGRLESVPLPQGRRPRARGGQ